MLESFHWLKPKTIKTSTSNFPDFETSLAVFVCRQWSACSSDDCDLSDPAALASGDVTGRPCGDGQSEVSADSSGSDSAAGRRPPLSGSGSGFGPAACGRLARSGSGSGSGSVLRSPRAARRCSADCACAVKISRSSLRRTGVLDGVGEHARTGVRRGGFLNLEHSVLSAVDMTIMLLKCFFSIDQRSQSLKKCHFTHNAHERMIMTLQQYLKMMFFI